MGMRVIDLKKMRGGVVLILLRGLILLAGVSVFIGLVFVTSLDFRTTESIQAAGLVGLIRHVVLVPGLIPLSITAVWAVYARDGEVAAKGLGLIALSIVIHYVVVAFSAHDDRGYRWVQLVECAFGVFAIRQIIRITNRSKTVGSTD